MNWFEKIMARLGTHDVDIKALLTPEIADILADVTGINGDAMRGTNDAALEASLGAHDVDIKAMLTTVQADLDDTGQYKADVAALALEASLGAHDVDIKAMLTTIAGYLDAEILAIIASQGRILIPMTFEGGYMTRLQIDQAATTLPITPTVTVHSIPVGATVVIAKAYLKFRMLENFFDGANALDGDTVTDTSQVIQVMKAAGAWVDAINFVDDLWTFTEKAREGGDVALGTENIAGEVDGNGVYTFRYLLSKADQDSIYLDNIQPCLRLWYSI